MKVNHSLTAFRYTPPTQSAFQEDHAEYAENHNIRALLHNLYCYHDLMASDSIQGHITAEEAISYLKRLPEDMQDAVLFYIVEGHQMCELASHLSCSMGKASNIIHQAVRLLNKEVGH